MKKIFVTQAVREELCRLFSVVDDTVGRALNYRSNSALAKKIRSVAIQKGGKVAGGDVMETSFDSVGNMIQTWGDTARLVANKESGHIKVYINGELEREYEEMTISELIQEQHRIGLLVNSR